MKKSRTLFAIFTILIGGFLIVSYFIEQPAIQLISSEFFLCAERLLAAMLFFTIVDTSIIQVRRTDNDGKMRIIRTVGFGVFLAVLILGLIKGPDSPELNRIIFFLQQTLESALAGLVCLSLIYAIFRLPGQDFSAMKAAFFTGMILFLVIYLGIPKMLDLPDPVLKAIEWVESIPQGALMGLMIGIALGGAITGLRFLLSGSLPARRDK